MSTTIAPDYDRGSVVTYRNFLHQEVTVVVAGRQEHKGRPGFVGVILGASEDPSTFPTAWGADAQIVAVVRR